MVLYSVMPRASKSIEDLSLQSVTLLKVLGENLKYAIEARENLGDFADRTQMHRQTLRKVLQGNPSVPIGFYVSALEALGLSAHLDGIAAPERDDYGQALRLGKLNGLSSSDLPDDF